MFSKIATSVAILAAGVDAACTAATPCSDCELYNACPTGKAVVFPNLNALECTAVKVQASRATGVDTLGDRTQIQGGLDQAQCGKTVEQFAKDEGCPVPTGAALDTARDQLIASGLPGYPNPADGSMVSLVGTPSMLAAPLLGHACTGDCCKGGNPPATVCGTHQACASWMTNGIADNHMMLVMCMNNQYIFDRVANASAAAAPTAFLTPAYGAVIAQYATACNSMLATMSIPCNGNGMQLGMQKPQCCEAAMTMGAKEIMTVATHSAMKSSVTMCSMHGANNGGCEMDGLTPTALAIATAQATIMADSCTCGGAISAQMNAAAKAVLDADGDNILDACSTTTTTTTTVEKKKDSSAAGVSVSIGAMVSAVFAALM